jgi:hypothetical protein
MQSTVSRGADQNRAEELNRMARENDWGADEEGAAELLASAVLRAEERREGAIDIDVVKRALFLLRGARFTLTMRQRRQACGRPAGARSTPRL